MLGYKEQAAAGRIIHQLSELVMEQGDAVPVQTERDAYTDIIKTRTDCCRIQAYLKELKTVRKTMEACIENTSLPDMRKASLQNTIAVSRQTETIWTRRLLQKKRHISKMYSLIQNMHQAEKTARTIDDIQAYEQIRDAVLTQRRNKK